MTRKYGDRIFQPALPMTDMPTLAGTFARAGYQTSATGKLHVYPTRARIGFEEAFIAEEGRSHLGGVDDYEIYLAENSFAGQQIMLGMSNNEYSWRTWHLDEKLTIIVLMLNYFPYFLAFIWMVVTLRFHHSTLLYIRAT